jgi:hypothetical protein
VIFGAIGGVLLSVIFGCIALSKIRQTGQKGRGLAIAGLVLSGFWVLAIGSFVAFGAAGTTTAKPADRVAAGTVFALHSGDCYTRSGQNPAETTTTACTAPHDGEIYGIAAPHDGAYPGEAKLQESGTQECQALVKSFFTKTTPAANLRVQVYIPSADGWDMQYRSAMCAFENQSGQLTAPVPH